MFKSDCSSNQTEKMSFKGSFSFKNPKILEANINDNVCVRLERVGFAISRLYFVQDAAEVNIPDGVEVFDDTNGGVPVFPIIATQFFVLAWSDNYTVKLNGIPIMGLMNQRQWDVTGDRDTAFRIIEN